MVINKKKFEVNIGEKKRFVIISPKVINQTINSTRKEIIGITTTWRDIVPIEQGGLPQEHYIVEDLFETPLQEAGQILWNKGICTIMSGANMKEGFNASQTAHIIINYDKLSIENKEVANDICKIEKSPFRANSNIAILEFKIGELSPWEVKNKMNELVKMFK